MSQNSHVWISVGSESEVNGGVGTCTASFSCKVASVLILPKRNHSCPLLPLFSHIQRFPLEPKMPLLSNALPYVDPPSDFSTLWLIIFLHFVSFNDSFFLEKKNFLAPFKNNWINTTAGTRIPEFLVKSLIVPSVSFTFQEIICQKNTVSTQSNSIFLLLSSPPPLSLFTHFSPIARTPCADNMLAFFFSHNMYRHSF